MLKVATQIGSDARFRALTLLLAADVAGEQLEVVSFAFCDSRGRVLGTRRFTSGAVDQVSLSVRQVVANAVLLDADHVVMAHNHPQGEAWPSRADRELTARIARGLASVDSRLFDHIVVGRNGAQWSFRAAGLL